MGPSQRCSESRSVQARRGPGRRLCLLKGCERSFQPLHPLRRYCSSACRAAAARRWHQQRTPTTAIGRASRVSAAVAPSRVATGNGSANASSARSPPAMVARAIPTGSAGTFWCDRPGCYDGFVRTGRSPLQKFCSAGCRQALRRVLIRERRWRRVLPGPVRAMAATIPGDLGPKACDAYWSRVTSGLPSSPLVGLTGTGSRREHEKRHFDS